MFLYNNVWLTFFFCLSFFKLVKAQASPKNPFIWQINVQYDLSQSNKTKTYIADTSSKVYSQDFQTVYEHKDRYGYNERLVLNFGDGCPGTTISDIEGLNGNWATSPSMMSQPSIALVKRGGRCATWSDKIAAVQDLSNAYSLQVTGIVIYDNNTYNDTVMIKENTTDPSYPTWSSPLPAERNIRNMTSENIIDTGTTFVAVYFVPQNYIQSLNESLIQNTFQKNGSLQAYTQLMFFLQEDSFSLDDPDDSDSNSNSNSGGLDDEKRNYIIYSITGAVVLILVFMIARWCRSARTLNRTELAERGENLLMTDMQLGDVIPFEKLAKICPILKYRDVNTLNTTCAICLDDFKDDYYVRVLPCHHGYCTACIDVWLTKKSSSCPICKYDCKDAIEEKDDFAKSSTTSSSSSQETVCVDSQCEEVSVINRKI